MKLHDKIKIKEIDNTVASKQSGIGEITELIKPIVVLEAASTYYKLKLAKTVLVKGAATARRTATVVVKVAIFAGIKISNLFKTKQNDT